MNELRPKAAIIVAGQWLTFWEFLASAVVAYLVAAAAMFGGILGMIVSAALATSTTAFLLYGLLLFSTQRPKTALVVITVFAVIHVALLRAHVPAGLFWLVWSEPGMYWLEDHGL